MRFCRSALLKALPFPSRDADSSASFLRLISCLSQKLRYCLSVHLSSSCSHSRNATIHLATSGLCAFVLAHSWASASSASHAESSASALGSSSSSRRSSCPSSWPGRSSFLLFFLLRELSGSIEWWGSHALLLLFFLLLLAVALIGSLLSPDDEAACGFSSFCSWCTPIATVNQWLPTCRDDCVFTTHTLQRCCALPLGESISLAV